MGLGTLVVMAHDPARTPGLNGSCPEGLPDTHPVGDSVKPIDYGPTSMLSMHDEGLRLCDGLTRRRWLQIGGLGALAGSLAVEGSSSQCLAGRPAPAGKARACIVLFFLGAPPQHETWDPKPDAPAEVRGDLRPIASATPGLLVGELMPRTARLTQRIAVLRAVQTSDNAHSSSAYFMTTGQPHQPRGVENARPGAPNDWPCLGAVVRKLWRRRCVLPAAATLPEQAANDGNLTWPGQDAGFLGRSADPWLLHCEPEKPGFAIPGLSLPPDVPAERFTARRSLLARAEGRLDRQLGAYGAKA